MRYSLVLAALLSVISCAPTPATFLGDAFMQALAGRSSPKFAAKIALPAANTATRRNLSLFRDATLALNLNVTKPVDFLDEPRDYPYPAFGKCTLSKDSNEVVPFTAISTLGPYFTDLFLNIPAWTKGAISLSRFDLFHAHLFANPITKTAGVVFHSKEYPAVDNGDFPYNLGFCQVNSNLPFDDNTMRRRNLVWTIDSSGKTEMWWIDMAARTGNEGVDQVFENGPAPFYTLYEGDLGHVVADFYYLEGLELGISLY